MEEEEKAEEEADEEEESGVEMLTRIPTILGEIFRGSFYTPTGK
jgi:hypothetical protein